MILVVADTGPLCYSKEKAAERNLIDLRQAFQRLLRTNFHIARDLLQQALQRDAARRKLREGDQGPER